METLKILVIGVLSIIFGIVMIWFTYKTRQNTQLVSTNLKGYSAGILAIFIAILYMLRNLHIINW